MTAEQAVASRVVPASAPTLLASNTPEPQEPAVEHRYAQREAQSQKLQDFRGGEVIVIGAASLLVVLLIVVLLILLLRRR